jgi:soluble lytic murein transglycosylase
VPGLAAAASRELPTEAAYLAAWLPFDAGRHADAAAALRRYAEERPGAPRALDARWFEAWSLRRLGRIADARRAFSELERTALAPAALYWGARLAPPAAARGLYRRAIAAEPGGWYALLSTARLAAQGERAPAMALPPGTPIDDGPGGGPAGEVLEIAAALLGVGLRDAALAELRAIAAPSASRGAAAAVAQLAAAAGDAELAFRIARDQLAPTRRTVRWAHPLAYPAVLPKLAADADVDPFLLLALARRESSFRPDARSPAGAVGLVQLLPRTAERLARLVGVSRAVATALAEPETSLALGAAYLTLLTDRLGDDATVLFAYNGGPQAAAGWARARAGRPLDEAVEEIPYRESRRYVKAVLAARTIYASLWGGAALSIDGARPLRAPGEGVAF